MWSLWLRHMGASGTFVDVGASDGVTLSNTLFFEKLGWSGLCVEPRPDAFRQLVDARPGSVCEQCAIQVQETDAIAFTQFFGYGSGLSGVDDKRDPRSLQRLVQEKRHPNHKGAQKIFVKGAPLQTLLDRHNITKINYLSVDVEDSEMDVISSIDFSRVSIDVMTIENNYNKPDVRELLKRHGYVWAGKIDIDDVFVCAAMHRAGACVRLNWRLPPMRGLARPVCASSPRRFDCFLDAIYVVNLEHRTDRWNHISGVLDALDVEYVRWEASYGKDVPTTPHEVRHISKLGAIGCRDSHIKIAKDAIAKGCRSYLVFEDDAVFTGGSPMDLRTACALWKSVQPAEWDLFYLGGNKLRQDENPLGGLTHAADIFCTHAYMASDRMAHKIVRDAANSGIPIDEYFRTVQNQDGQSFALNRSLFGQMDDYSDIEQTVTTGRLYGKL